MRLTILAGMLCFTATLTYADTINFSLSSPTQTVIQGGTATFAGTLSAPVTNTGNEYVNQVGFSGPPGSLIDFNGIFALFSSFPRVLAPGQSLTGNIFSVITTTSTPAATYNNLSFFLVGGSSSTANMNIATANYNLTVLAGSSTVPEPSTFLLLGTVLFGGIIEFGRKRTIG